MPLGLEDRGGGRLQSTSEEVGNVAEDKRCGYDCETPNNKQEASHEAREHQQLQWRPDEPASPGSPGRSDANGEESIPGHGQVEDRIQGGQASHSHLRGRDYYEQSLEKEAPRLLPTSLDQDVITDNALTQMAQVSTSEARSLESQSERLLPECFEGLAQHGRPVLFEIACSPDSVLTEKMQKLTKRVDSAKRFSFWNGYDVSTSQGVRAIIAAIEREKPMTVWLSLECGPFSRMQQVNQRTEKQIQELQSKREACMRMYVGGLLVFTHCVQHGIPVTWEWSETCDAWRLPMVQRVFDRFQPWFVVVKGCRVKLQAGPNQGLLGKGWKLATTHQGIADQMDLPCVCQAKHVPCQGKLTRMSAYYTDDFAKRVCRAVLHDMDTMEVFHEVRGHARKQHNMMGMPAECTCHLVQHPRSNLKCNICEFGEEKQSGLSMVGEEADADMEPMDPEDRDRCLRHIGMLHRNTGHGPIEHLVRALTIRRADPRIIELAKGYTCPVCNELKRQVPRPQTSLEPLPAKWQVIQADNAFWTHPHTHDRYQFTIIIDEGCRFRVGRMMCKGSGGVSGDQLIKMYQEMWKPIFGRPRKLRVDPAGAWRSNNVDRYMEGETIEIDNIPAEAHWGISHVERAIECTKRIMTKLAWEEPGISGEEALAEAIRVENEREIVRGYSPAQHALGRAPGLDGRFDEAAPGRLKEVLCEHPDGEFQRNVDRMRSAERAMTEYVYDERVKRAKNTRANKVQQFSPGDLVFVWRLQVPANTSGLAGASRKGGFTGPCRVLATETRLTPEGQYRPGSVVWLVRGSRLIKASPHQLRKASLTEEYVETLVAPPELPWTFTKLSEDLSSRQCEDATGDLPDDMEIQQGIDEEQAAPFRRVRRKRNVPGCPAPSQEVQEGPEADPFGHLAQNHREEGFMCDEAECFWSSEQAAVEVEIPIPESHRGRKYMFNNFESYLSSQLRRKGVEVSERHMSSEEIEQMRGAKQEEVKKFIGAQALQALPSHLQPSASIAMKMRWILTWKHDHEGRRTPKARCVVLGYQDPQYEHRQTMAPAMSRSTRQVMLAIAASLKMRVAKGDVSGAFLQGRQYQHDAYVIPTDEICAAMGVPSGSITKLRKACYGLVDAPLEWFMTVSDFLVSIGFQRCVTDPCCFKFVDPKKGLIGLISGHVDDFLFCGRADCSIWEALCQTIRDKFKWGTWEYDSEGFTQCGVRVEKSPDGGFELSQSQYIEEISEMTISAERRRSPKEPTTDFEKTKIRGALGALSWCAQQTAPHLAAAVSLFLSQVQTSTVETMIAINKLIYRTRCNKKHIMKIHGGIPVRDWLVAGWSDAAAMNRPDGKSTLGVFVGITSKSLIHGEMCPISPVFWRSAKIERQCRSPGASEALAAISCEDAMYGIRLQVYEFLGNAVHVRRTETHVAQVPGVLVTDSTNVHDRLKSEIYVPKGPEYRTALELVGLKEASVHTHMPIRWVHSDAQLANSLTKDSEQQQLQRFYNLGHRWRIIDDPLMRSARNRKKQGLGPLDNTVDLAITGSDNVFLAPGGCK